MNLHSGWKRKRLFTTRKRNMLCFQLILIFLSVVLYPDVAALTIIWMAPSEAPYEDFQVNASTSVGALALAVETVYNESILAPGSLNVIWLDSQCSSKQSIGQLTAYIFNALKSTGLDVIIGPPCTRGQWSCRGHSDLLRLRDTPFSLHLPTYQGHAKVRYSMIPIAQLSSFREIPVFQWIGNKQALDDKEELNTLVRTIPPLSDQGGILADFLSNFEWKRIVMISSSDQVHKAFADAISSSILQNANLGVYIVHHYSDTAVNISTADLHTILTSIQKEARIVMLILSESELRKYMIEIENLGMANGEYQFLFLKAALPSQQEINVLKSNRMWKRGDQYDSKAKQGFENLLFVIFENHNEDIGSWQQDAIDAASRLYGTNVNMPPVAEPDEYSTYLHDTILLYAKVLNSSGVSDYSTLNGSTIAKMTSEVTFLGLSGEVLMVPNKADRYPAVVIYDLTEQGNFSEVAHFWYSKESTSNHLTLNSFLGTIRWGNGLTSATFHPSDTPDCGFYGELCITSSDGSNVGLYVGLSVGMLALMMILLLLYRLWRRERELQNTSWKIDYTDLDFSVGKRAKSFMMSTHRSTHSTHSGTTDKNTDLTFGQTTLTDSFMEVIQRQGQPSAVIAKYRRNIVVVKHIRKKKITIDRTLLKEMRALIDMKHNNVTSLRGMCTEPGHVCILWEYCSKGSLQDIIENDDIKLDTMFKLSIAIDICKGLEYIHKSDLKYHGNLKSTNCVVDSRWTCKLTDFGLRYLMQGAADDPQISEDDRYTSLYWTAPEFLRKQMRRKRYLGSAAGDIYSFAIIAKELITGEGPYSSESHLSPKEILECILNSPDEKPFRPNFQHAIDDIKVAEQFRHIERLIETCWREEPQNRPSVKTVLKTLNKINPYKKSNVIENMIAMMEKYSNQLEELVMERTSQLEEEKRKTDSLLYRMLPRKIAEQLKLGRSVQAEAFECVTIYFSDIVGFTSIASDSSPLQIVDLLNSLYTLFDDVIESFDVYKVETIGDAYMIVSGLPEKNDDRHVTEMASVSLSLLNEVKNFKIVHMNNKQLEIRIGLHTGPVVAGVVGLTMPRYCLFGDTVNTASRMESNGQALKIHMSGTTAEMLNMTGQFNAEERGELDIKGKGMMTTYWLLGYSKDSEICVNNKIDNASPANTGYHSDTETGIDSASLKCSDTESELDSASLRGLHEGNNEFTTVKDNGREKIKVHTFFRTAPLPEAQEMDQLNADISDLFEKDNM